MPSTTSGSGYPGPSMTSANMSFGISALCARVSSSILPAPGAGAGTGAGSFVGGSAMARGGAMARRGVDADDEDEDKDEQGSMPMSRSGPGARAGTGVAARGGGACFSMRSYNSSATPCFHGDCVVRTLYYSFYLFVLFNLFYFFVFIFLSSFFCLHFFRFLTR